MPPWWAGSVLGTGPGGLTIDGQPVASLAEAHGTPLYVYSRRAVQRRLAELRAALAEAGVPGRIYYALKANRFPPLLAAVRAAGDVGIDACSPREVALALAAGFAPGEISFTAAMLSNRDLDFLAAAGVHANLDTLSALRRYGVRVPVGTRVGLRLNPGVSVGYGANPRLSYGNSRFGFYDADFATALATAAAAGLVVDTLHIHCGWGVQMHDLPLVEEAFARLAGHARQVPTLAVVNVGGGLGARQQAADAPLSPLAWAGALRRHLAPLGLAIACEPGTFLVADAGILVVEVNTVEERGGVLWAGVDAGHNTNVYPFHYGIPLEIVAVARPDAAPERIYTVAGNINEAGDVFARQRPLPDVGEGDLLALLPAGAYGASMMSDHCLRGGAREIAV